MKREATISIRNDGSFPYEIGDFQDDATGVVSFVTHKTFRTSAGINQVRIATKPFSARAGGNAVVLVRLSPFMRRLLREQRRLKVDVRVTARGKSGVGRPEHDAFSLERP